MKEFGIVFLILTLCIGANMRGGFLMRLGFDANIMLAALCAIVIAALVVHRRMTMIVLVVGVTVAANLPKEFAASIGYDPDIMLAALVVLLVVPLLRRFC
jgi:hypothetical protein